MFSNVMVTGGCGFIASNFLNLMKERYPRSNFINVDKLDYCSNAVSYTHLTLPTILRV